MFGVTEYMEALLGTRKNKIKKDNYLHTLSDVHIYIHGVTCTDNDNGQYILPKSTVKKGISKKKNNELKMQVYEDLNGVY